MPPPSYSAMPAPSAEEAQLAPRPRAVDIAFFIFVGAVVIGLIVDIWIGATIAFTGQDLFRLAMKVVLVALAVTMRNGQNWARITLTVFAGLNVIGILLMLAAASLLVDLLGGLGTFLLAINAVVLVAIIAAIIFMYRPESNRYFSSR